MKKRPDLPAGKPARAPAVEKKVLAGLALAIMAVLLMGAVLYHNSRRFLEQAEWLEQAYIVQNKLGAMLVKIEGIQTGARGYALTGDEPYLLPYRAALATLEDDLREIRRLAADRPAQQPRLDRLESLLRARIQSAEHLIRLRREQGLPAAAEYVQAGGGKQLMDQIRELIRQMGQEEASVLQQRRSQQEATERSLQRLFLALMLGVTGLLAAVYLLIVRELAARRGAEQAARQSEERLLLAQKSARIGIWEMDIATGSMVWTDEVFTVMNLDPASGTPDYRNFLQVITPEDRVMVAEAIRATMEDGAEYAVEFRVPGEGGVPRWVTATGHVVRGEDGRPQRLVGACVDITERKRFLQEIESKNHELELRNREVERATQLKSQFLASMSHELRTPMNAILGFSELLSDEIAGELNEKQKHFVQRIRDGGQHLLRLINDILDLSKIEAGKVDLHMEDFSLAEALPEVVSNIRSLAMAKRVKLEVQVGPLRVHADRVRFKQVLYNLLSNAVKFTAEGGRVWVGSEPEDEMVRISVSDTGVGIAEQDLEVIFEEFRQVGATTRGLKEGTGLGLAITRRLVEQHGGRIWAESKPGEGTRFHFTLPACKEEAPARRAVAVTSTDRGTKPLVLVVDDEPAARELLADYLAPAGFQVEIAGSGREGVDKAMKLAPDVITLNMLTPGRGGLEALWELKSNPVTAAIPVIIVSVVDQRKMGFAMGAADYLLKPVSKQILLQALQRQLAATGKEQTVLIVDDDPEVLEMATEVLRAAGYRCLTADGGQKALDILQHVRPDAILLDLMMPEVDGFEVIRRIRENPALRDVPLFVLSAKDLTPSEVELLARETRAFLRKGISWKEELLAQVRKAVASSRPAGAS